MTNPLLFSHTLIATAPPHVAPPHHCHPPLSHYFTLFSLWQNEMDHSAVAAFQHSLRAEISLHKQPLIAVPAQVSVCLYVFFFFPPWHFVVWPAVCWTVVQGFQQIKALLQPWWYQLSRPLGKRTKHTNDHQPDKVIGPAFRCSQIEEINS